MRRCGSLFSQDGTGNECCITDTIISSVRVCFACMECLILLYVCMCVSIAQWSTCEFCAEHFASVTLCFPSSLLPPVVPAQPTRFEAEAELDTRIMLTWLWPVQDQIITEYELQYSEAGSDNKVRKTTWKF